MHPPADGLRASADLHAAVGRELRAQLSGVVGMAELLERDGLAGGQQAMVRTILESAAQLSKSIEDVMELLRTQTLGTRLQSHPVDLRELVEAAVSHVEDAAAARGVAVEAKVSGRVPELVAGDRDHLERMLANLLDPGVHLSDGGTVELRVLPAARGRGVRFELHASPAPVSHDRLDQLFHPFGGPGGLGALEGVGVGFALVRVLVEAQRGRLGWETRDEGIAVHVQLPLHPAQAPPKAAAPPTFRLRAQGDAPAIASVPPARAREPLRVLLVEDSVLGRNVATRLLALLDIKAETVADGQGAVDACEAREFDAILMDLALPDMSGIEAANAIRRRHGRKARIIAMTADTGADERRKCLEAGMTGFLAKPVRLHELAAALGVPVPVAPATKA